MPMFVVPVLLKYEADVWAPPMLFLSLSFSSCLSEKDSDKWTWWPAGVKQEFENLSKKKDWVHTIFSPLWEHCPKNPVYNAFHRFSVVETKRFVGISINVILTRQICGQRSSRAAERKRQALENSFLKQICYLFLIPKFRGDSDLGRCTFWALSKRKMLRHAEFGFFLRVKHVFVVRKSSRNMASKSRQIWEKRQDLGAAEKSFGYFHPNIAC